MGLLSDNNNYYFKLRNGVEYEIKATPIRINTGIMRNYRELTAEQREFYLSNPAATVREVVNCELTPPYVAPTPDVTEYAATKVRELKEACLASISITTVEYAMANAVLAGTSLTYSGAKHYTATEAKAVMKRFMDESDAAMTVYETYSASMSSASSVEDVDTLYGEAVSQLNA